jgi:hypothetical protein
MWKVCKLLIQGWCRRIWKLALERVSTPSKKASPNLQGSYLPLRLKTTKRRANMQRIRDAITPRDSGSLRTHLKFSVLCQAVASAINSMTCCIEIG